MFFNDGLINGDDEDVQGLQPLQGSDEIGGFRKLHTFVPVTLKLCLIVSYIYLISPMLTLIFKYSPVTWIL